MKKTLAGLGVLALVALGVTGASFPANAVGVQTVAEIVAESDAIIASPDAVLSQSETVVTTTAAEVPTEPVAVVADPVVAPVAPEEPVVAPEPVAVVAESPEAPVTAPEPVAVVEAPEPVAVDVPLDYWVTPDGSRKATFQGSAAEAFALYAVDVPGLSLEEQYVDFGSVYQGVYMAGYAPADTNAVPSVTNPSVVYVFSLR